MNESTFEICPHDRENPYVMISREMAQDKSISPKAKGVLLYLLSLPRDWKIYHSQLQNGLGVGEDYITSAMEELISNGYADRTRERVKGIFQPYKYKIREFKKINPDGKNQPGLTGPVNPALQKKERESKYTKKTTTQTAIADAAVSLEKEGKQKATQRAYQCLDDIDISDRDKLEVTRRYDEQTVKEAIAWAINPQTKITTTLAQAIKWACKERPEMTKERETPFEIVRKMFKNGELYNSAVCDIDQKSISFTRGMKFETIKFDQFFSWRRFQKLCDVFGIKITKPVDQ